MMRVTALAAVMAAGVALLVPQGIALLWRSPVTPRVILGQALAVGAAFFVGARLLEARPQWPPASDEDRFLLLLLPAVVLAETVATLFIGRWWLVWLPRLVVAGGAARVLLHGTVYLTDAAGPGTREWSEGQTALILGGSAAALLVVWGALDVLVRKGRGTSVCLAVAGTCAAAGVTIMLSGYLSGGQLGLPLGGALTGATLAVWFFSSPGRETGALAVGLVGLFALLIMGRFFGELTTRHALILLAAPLLCWLPELPRGVQRVVLVVALAAGVALQAWEKHQQEEQAPGNSWEGSSDDYEQFKGAK
jgi:hypothetical protein